MIKVRVILLDEVCCGAPTGRIVYHTEVVEGFHPMSAVLGRGSSPTESMRDFVRLSMADGYQVSFVDLVVAQQFDRTGRRADLRA